MNYTNFHSKRNHISVLTDLVIFIPLAEAAEHTATYLSNTHWRNRGWKSSPLLEPRNLDPFAEQTPMYIATATAKGTPLIPAKLQKFIASGENFMIATSVQNPLQNSNCVLL